MPEQGKCAACLRVRPLIELLAFWPVGSEPFPPRRFVCRPTLTEQIPPGQGGPCFRVAVGPASTHAIAVAA